MERVILTVPRPEPIDGDALDKLFNRSQAISSAVSAFWKLGLAPKAELGDVTETKNGYNVEILYLNKGGQGK